MNYIVYIFFRILIFVVSLAPFWLLHIYSDLFALLIRVVGYRKKVVYSNLRRVFPDKNETEIRKIANGFYSHFTDLFLETLKAFSMSPKNIAKRYVIKNKEVITNLLKSGKNLVCAGGHFCNWEWGTQAVAIQIDNPISGLYQPLTNKYIDKFIKNQREQRGCELFTTNDTRKMFMKKRPQSVGFIMIGDQSPSHLKKTHWVKFLNQDTACLHGIETYSKHYDLPVIYFEILKTSRSNYHIYIYLVTDNPNELSDGEITQRYMKLLETSIYKQPENYLWSHRRWKHVKKDDGTIVKTNGIL